MKESEANQRVMEVLAVVAGRGASEGSFPAEADLRDDLGMDSNRLLALAFRLESEFRMDIVANAEALCGIRTVEDVVRLVERTAQG